MPYYVVGGQYADTTFTHMIRPDAPQGPFARYEDALAAWRAQSIRHIDEAFVRYQIVREQAGAGVGEAAVAASA